MQPHHRSAFQFAIGCEKAMTLDSSPLAAAPITQPRFGEAYRVLSDGIAAGAFPGCAFGVLASGRVVLSDALGRFTYEAGAPQVAPDTIFDVASLTKRSEERRVRRECRSR